MGKHVGWIVRRDRDKWRAEVREHGRYRSRTFAVRPEATAWAKREAGAIAQGVALSLRAPGKIRTEEMVDQYLAGMRGRGTSATHLRLVGSTLAAVAEFAPDLSAPTAGEAIERWRDGLACSPSSRNRKLVELRGLINWAIKRDYLARDPTRAIARVAQPRKLKPMFSVDELRAMIAGAADEPWALRCALLIYSGMRFQEAAFLRWQDVDFQGRTLRVSLESGAAIKRDKERLIPLQDELAALLLPMRGKRGPIAETALGSYVRDWRAHLGRRGVAIDGRTPHSLRHCYAAIMSATGVAAPIVGDYLGHASAQTTAGYTRLAARYVAQVEGWPRGQFRLLDAREIPGK